MSTAPLPSPLAIGVVGAGTMGRGIAQLFAQSGHTVLCHDAVEGAAARAVDTVQALLAKLAAKGKLSAAAHAAAKDRLIAVAGLAELARCDLVVEAIVEDLAVKRELFVALEGIVSERCVLASNTSSLTVSEIAAACRHPERVAGLHFFNPVPLMRVAEVIAAVRTSPEVAVRLRELIEATGHRAVVTADQPGFLVNHAGRGLYTEGLRLLEEQVADVAQIDTVLREAAGFRMGPFELLDLTGLDVSSRVMTSLYAQFHQEPRFRPSSLVAPRVAAGLFGRKTGQGWYVYANDVKQVPAAAPVPSSEGATAVWIDPQAPELAALLELASRAGARRVDDAADPRALLVIQPIGFDASTVCIERGLDASRCVAVDPLPGLARHRTLMLTAITGAAFRDTAHALFAADGVGVTVINDSPGFIVQRVLATIVNIAANLVQRGIASVADLEDAVRLGLGYPHGPLAWGDELGGARVLEVLRRMQQLTGDPRYRPSAWLTRRVGLGLSLTTPEAPRAQAGDSL